jgi:prephenate dehydrogenase
MFFRCKSKILQAISKDKYFMNFDVKTGLPSKVAVLGYGLIGGSIAQAVMHCGQFDGLLVWDSASDAMESAAAQLGSASVASSLQAAVANADIIVIAVPIASFREIYSATLRFAPPNAIVSDVASVKRAVIQSIIKLSDSEKNRLIPVHPIAGSEKSGPMHASPTLFKDRSVFVTPTLGTDGAKVAKVCSFWNALGAKVKLTSVDNHDQIYSAVSHLPHLIAFAYLSSISSGHDGGGYVEHAGPGFADFTRIAGANPTLWADICLSNKECLTNDLVRFSDVIKKISTAISSNDRESLKMMFDDGQRLRLNFEAIGVACTEAPDVEEIDDVSEKLKGVKFQREGKEFSYE